MARLIDQYKGWRDRRRERYLAKWATTRKKGKSHYVAGIALAWALAMTFIVTLMNYLSGEPDDIAKFTIRLVISFLGGLVVGLISWNAMEKQYRGQVTAGEVDRVEWERDWAAVQHRDLPDTTNIDLKTLWGRSDLGDLKSASITTVPEKYLNRLYFPSEQCPLCGKVALESNRMPANMTLLVSVPIGVSVWIHEDCFAPLPLSSKPPAIPW